MRVTNLIVVVQRSKFARPPTDMRTFFDRYTHVPRPIYAFVSVVVRQWNGCIPWCSLSFAKLRKEYERAKINHLFVLRKEATVFTALLKAVGWPGTVIKR